MDEFKIIRNWLLLLLFIKHLIVHLDTLLYKHKEGFLVVQYWTKIWNCYHHLKLKGTYCLYTVPCSFVCSFGRWMFHTNLSHLGIEQVRVSTWCIRNIHQQLSYRIEVQQIQMLIPVSWPGRSFSQFVNKVCKFGCLYWLYSSISNSFQMSDIIGCITLYSVCEMDCLPSSDLGLQN